MEKLYVQGISDWDNIRLVLRYTKQGYYSDQLQIIIITSL